MEHNCKNFKNNEENYDLQEFYMFKNLNKCTYMHIYRLKIICCIYYLLYI